MHSKKKWSSYSKGVEQVAAQQKSSYVFAKFIFSSVLIVSITACAVPNASGPPNIWHGGDSTHRNSNSYDVSTEFFQKRPTKLAVVWTDGTEKSFPIYDTNMSRVMLRKGYRVAARRDLDKVLEEIKFQQSGLTKESAYKIAQFLDVDAILISKRDYRGEYSFEGVSYLEYVLCDLVSLPDGEVLYSSVDCFNGFPERSVSR